MVFSLNENPAWLEITVDAAPEFHDPLSAFFFDLGATGVVLEDFGDRALKAYLPLNESLQQIQDQVSIHLGRLSLIFPHLPRPVFRVNRIKNQDWQKNWRRLFGPVQVTPNLMILPLWEDLQPQGTGPCVIRIDPGPAFGTGQHPTTRMCLQAMESLGPGKNHTLLDVGCGSGILAIYGAKLGFTRVDAIDVDPEAVRWAGRNIQLNGLARAISVSDQRVEAIKACYTRVCANLILGELLRLLPHLSRLVEKGGFVVISGILTEQVTEMKEAVMKTALTHTGTLTEDEWACMILGKDGA